MAKLPAFQFYPGDWMKDPALSMCAPATRGIWIDILCAMHESGRSGRVTGTIDQLCRVCRCTSAELDTALEELSTTRAADVVRRTSGARDGAQVATITVTCRRMSRECHERETSAQRKRRQRLKDGGGDESRDGPAVVPEKSRGRGSCPVERVVRQLDPDIRAIGVDGLRDAVWRWCEYRLRADGKPPDPTALQLQLLQIANERAVAIITACIREEKPRLFADVLDKPPRGGAPRRNSRDYSNDTPLGSI